MPDRRRVLRQPCDLQGRVFAPGNSLPILCSIEDISSHGAFLRAALPASIPANFDLLIGTGNAARACRLARRVEDGVGVEFLDPVRSEIEELISTHVLQAELLYEAVAGLSSEGSPAQLRLARTVDALMRLIEDRNAMAWTSTEMH